jgi:hypothetical protein
MLHDHLFFEKVKSVQKEYPLELTVSQHIGDMPFLWIELSDKPGPESLRGYIERNSIALLSNFDQPIPIDPPSSQWLGNWVRRDEIKHSGLWNLNHVDETCDPNFLDVMKKLLGMH